MPQPSTASQDAAGKVAVAPRRAPAALKQQAGDTARHVPAVTAVVLALAQQAQAEQPGVATAAAPQQQPPRHTPVPQSKLEPHTAPGAATAHWPDPGAHVEQPARAESAAQHAPPRHGPKAHAAPAAEQAAPTGSGVAAAVGERAGVAVRAAEPVPVGVRAALPVPVAGTRVPRARGG